MGDLKTVKEQLKNLTKRQNEAEEKLTEILKRQNDTEDKLTRTVCDD